MLALRHVLARFPDRANEIRRLCLKDFRFRSICEDLELAHAALNGPHAGRDAMGSGAARDLRDMRDELEAELLGHLDAPEGRRLAPE